MSQSLLSTLQSKSDTMDTSQPELDRLRDAFCSISHALGLPVDCTADDALNAIEALQRLSRQRESQLNSILRQHMPLEEVPGLEGWSRVVEATTANEKCNRLQNQIEKESTALSAVVTYMLGLSASKDPIELLRLWNMGEFQAIRREWPDAPDEIYAAENSL